MLYRKTGPSACRSRITVGQRVQADRNPEPLTVEAISYGTFGSIASCIRFDDHGHITTHRFPVRYLTPCEGDGSYERIAIGQAVTLRSGSPVLTVISVNAGADRIICTWRTRAGKNQKRQFTSRSVSRQSA